MENHKHNLTYKNLMGVFDEDMGIKTNILFLFLFFEK